MTALNSINTIANTISNVDNIATNASTSALGDTFGQLLDSTIKENGLNAAISSTNIQDGFKEVFNELGLGIATSLVSALSGSTTTTADVTDENTSDLAATKATDDLDSTDSSEEVAETDVATSNEETSLKSILDSIALLTANQSISSEAKNTLSSLQSILLESDDSNDEESKQTT